ncbi:exo-alpha-sialidase [candidate division WOR-3 bacterium]|nr:exo-alpha-sialidase [candidate division WOR-3 bacterium]
MRIIVVCLLVLFTAALADPPWTPNVRAADCGDTINEGESCIAADGDFVYCISNTNERNRLAVIPYGRSTDGGATWTTTWWKDPTAPNTWHTDPVLLVDDTGYVHMFIQYSTSVIRHYLSTDHGSTWCDTTDVSTTGSVDKPWGCIGNNDIYMAWQDVGSSAGIYFARSTDGGRSWTNRRIDSNNTGITGICCSPSGIIYLMNRNWGDDGVLFTRSTDRGATFAPWLTITTGCTYTSGYGDRAPLPSIAAPTDSNVVITWVDDRYGNWDVLYVRSTDGGATWSSLAQLCDSTAGGQCKGWVTADPFGGLHFLWYHTPSWPTSASSWWSVRYRHSDDYGATFSPSIRLTDTVFRSPVSFIGEYHVMVTDDEYVRAVWADGRGTTDLDLYFAQARLDQIGIEENPFRVVRQSRVWVEAPATARGAVPVRFGLRGPARAGLSVYDALGRCLKTIDLGVRSPGTHLAAIPDLGAAGTIFIRLEADEVATARTTLLP